LFPVQENNILITLLQGESRLVVAMQEEEDEVAVEPW
jgi:hypothetical protein